MNYIDIFDSAEKSYVNSNYKKALLLFEKAYSYNPSNTIMNYIGCCYLQLDNYEKAENIFKSLIETTHWGTPCYNLARVYIKLNMFDKAYVWLNEALEINPDCDDCYFYMGVYFERKNDYQKAIEYYKKGLLLCDDDYDIAMYYTNIGICYRNMQDNKNAIIHFNKALDAYKDYTPAIENINKTIGCVTFKEEKNVSKND